MVDLISSPYELSENWLKNSIVVKTEKDDLKTTVTSSVLAFKGKKVDLLIAENQEKNKRRQKAIRNIWS